MTIRGLGRVHGLRSGGPLLATPVGDAAINWFIYPIYSLLLSKRKLRSQRQKGKPNRQRKFLQNHHDPKSEYNTMRRLLVFTYETIRVSSASETFTCLSLSSLQHPGHRKACLFGLVRLCLCHTVCFFLCPQITLFQSRWESSAVCMLLILLSLQIDLKEGSGCIWGHPEGRERER